MVGKFVPFRTLRRTTASVACAMPRRKGASLKRHGSDEVGLVGGKVCARSCAAAGVTRWPPSTVPVPANARLNLPLPSGGLDGGKVCASSRAVTGACDNGVRGHAAVAKHELRTRSPLLSNWMVGNFVPLRTWAEAAGHLWITQVAAYCPQHGGKLCAVSTCLASTDGRRAITTAPAQKTACSSAGCGVQRPSCSKWHKASHHRLRVHQGARGRCRFRA